MSVVGVGHRPRHIGTGPRPRGHGGLLAWFDAAGARRVDLNVDPDGMALYRELGFADHPAPTLSLKR